MLDVKKRNRELKSSIKENNTKEISTKLYLIRPSFILLEENLDNVLYDIYKEISEKFNIPMSNIRITGSAHLGFSLKDDHDFTTESDLDIAIIDCYLFNKFLSNILNETKNYARNDSFFKNDKYDNLSSYKKNICMGKIHPLYFPTGEIKREWNSFFDSITRKHNEYFSKITACIFLSEECFRLSQENSLNKFNIG